MAYVMAALVTLSAVTMFCGLASFGVLLVCKRVTGKIDQREAASRAGVLFGLRVLPMAAAVIGAFAVVLPFFLWFEPGNSQERIPVTLMLAAACGAILLVRAGWRAALAVNATIGLSRRWQAQGRRLTTVRAPFPIIVVDSGLPTIAVVGFFRPTVFLSARLLDECTDEEVRAMIAHECAHVGARDNLKRLMLRSCPGLGNAGRYLEEAWRSASEEAADAVAAARAPEQALPLAQALVRAARLAPMVPYAASLSAFYEAGHVEQRVRRLLGPPHDQLPVRRQRLPLAVLALAAGSGLVVAGPAIHQLMEAAIALLP